MFLDGLDELDRKIVRLLIQNARMSYSEIGEQVGISRVAVKMRVQALEKKGIIEEYTAIINPQKINGAISCYFEIETMPDTLSEVTELLRQSDIITQIYRVTGKCKLHVHAVAASGEEMEALILENNLIKKYQPKYNVLLRDDKTYPYIKVTTSEEYPRVVKTRIIKKDGDRYFGPYSDAGAVNLIVDLMNNIYSLKRCSMTEFPKGHRP